MGATIDERIVSIAFEHRTFEAGVSQTIATLGKLDKAISGMSRSTGLQDLEKQANKVTLAGPTAALDKLQAKVSTVGAHAATGFSEIDRAGNKVQLEEPARAIDKLAARFGGLVTSGVNAFSGVESAANKVDLQGLSSALSGATSQFSILENAASVALGNIAAQATMRGAAFAKSFAFGPLQQGFQEYGTNLGSIQTILANTQGQKVTGLDNVNKALAELNAYSDKTIYNFSEMAKNIGTFTAAGVQLPLAVKSIKGIANLAALSGSNSEQAARAMYQLSQAISSGRVSLMDWNSVVNAGMGGAVFQKALMRTAENMGALEKGAVKIDKATGKATVNGQSFRESIQAKPGQQSWLTSDVLTDTLAQFTGDMSKAELAAKGFSDSQIKAIQSQAKAATEAATQVKTLPQVFDVARETIGSGWAKTFQLIFGDFKESKKTFTELSNAVNGVINGISDRRNKLLEEWKAGGGRDILLGAFRAALEAVAKIAGIVKDAFHEIFPPKTALQLVQLTASFSKLMGNMIPSTETAKSLKHIFEGFFAVVKIGTTALGDVVQLFGEAGSNAGSLLPLLMRMADFLINLNAGFQRMGGLTDVLEGVKNIFVGLVGVVGDVYVAFQDFFRLSGDHPIGDLVTSFLELTQEVRGFLEDNAGLLIQTFDGFFAILHIGVTTVKGLVGMIGRLFGQAENGPQSFIEFTARIGDFLSRVDEAYTKMGGLGGLFAVLADEISHPKRQLDRLGHALEDLFDKIRLKDGESLSSKFGEMADKIKPLGKVVDVTKKALDGLKDSLSGVRDFLEPVFSTLVDEIEKMGDGLTKALMSIKLDDAASAITAGFAGGIFLMLKKALTGGISVKFFDGVKRNVVDTLDSVKSSLASMQNTLQAATLVEIAIAMALLANAMYKMAQIDGKALAKSLGAMAIGFGELVATMRFISKGALGLNLTAGIGSLAVSMVVLSGAMLILSFAMRSMSKMNWNEIAKGLVAVGGSLKAISIGVQGFPLRVGAIGLGLIPLAVGLGLLGVALKIFATLSIMEMAKSLTVLSVALKAIGGGVATMGPSLLLVGPGLIAAGIGLVFISQALGKFGEMSLGEIAKGIIALAASLEIIGITVTAMGPGMIVGAAGLLVTGIALQGVVAAVGFLGHMKIGTLVKGITSLAAVLVVLAVGLTAMALTLPGAAGLMAAAVALAVLGPALGFLGNLDWGTIFKGLTTVVLSMVAIGLASIVAGPALLVLGLGLTSLGVGLLLVSSAIYVTAKGLALLSSEGQKGIGVLIAAMTGFIALLPRLVIDTVKGLVGVLDAVVDLMPKIVDSLAAILASLVDLVIRTAPKLGLAIGVLVDTFLLIIGEKAGPIMDAGWKLLMHFLKGVDDNVDKVGQRVASIIGKFLGRLDTEAPRLIDAGAKVIVTFLSGIDRNLTRVINHAAKVGLTFLQGIIQNGPKFVVAGAKAINAFLQSISDQLPGVIKKGARVVIKFMEGIGNQFKPLADKATETVEKFFNAIGNRENTRRMVDAGLKAILHFIQGISDGIKKDENLTKIIQAAQDVGIALVEGIVKGLASLPLRLGKHLMEPLDDAVHKIKKKLKIFSPSRVFVAIGENIVEGLGNGLAGMATALDRGITNPIGKMLRANKDVKAFGRFLGKDFADAISGGFEPEKMGATQEKVLAGFASLRTKLGDEQKKLQDQIKQDRDKLKSYSAKEQADTSEFSAYDKTNRSLQAHIKLLAASKSASKNLISGMTEEKNELLHLGGQYDELTQQMADATAEVDRLKGLRESLQKSTVDQYSALPGFEDSIQAIMDDMDLTWQERQEKRREKEKEEAKRRRIDLVAEYKKSLEEQIKATEAFHETLNRLRELGLDDATYEKLLKEGPKAQGFADALLRGGKQSVDEINNLDAQLLKDATDLANEAAKAMYDVGIKAAEGIVDGLERDRDKIAAQMDKIADTLVDSIKRKLGIKSPSRVLAEVGKFAALGMAEGLKASSRTVGNAAAGVGDEAATAMAQSLAHISDALSSEIDPDLTITPVLDLTQVQKDAQKLSDLTNVTPITAAASFGQASAISTDVAATQEALAAQAAGAPTVIFEQTNNSPESLSNVEIYRNTKNLLSQAKSALGVAS